MTTERAELKPSEAVPLWLALPPEFAITLANSILAKANPHD